MNNTKKILNFKVENLESQKRVDQYLAEKLGESRNQIEKLIKSENIKINQKIIKKPSFKIQNEDLIEVTIFEKSDIQEEFDKEALNFDIEILYEDDFLMVLNKPANLVVHSAPSVNEPTLVDWLKSKNISLSTINGDERHGIVHRLDKNTTGAIVIAKDNKTHQLLSDQLSDKTMGRFYLAIANYPLKDDQIVDVPILRNPTNRLKMAFLNNSIHGRNLKSREAKTYFHKFKTSIETTQNRIEELVICKLFTGRTHQIRVHLNALNRYVLGDDLYGFKSKDNKIDSIMLHAYLLYFVHPITNKKIFVQAPIFDKMSNYLKEKFDFDMEIKENEKLLQQTIYKIDEIFS